MEKFKIKVKDVKEFVKNKSYIYASGGGKTFSVSLHAGPNVDRYTVEHGETKEGFTDVGEAVKYFNEI